MPASKLSYDTQSLFRPRLPSTARMELQLPNNLRFQSPTSPPTLVIVSQTLCPSRYFSRPANTMRSLAPLVSWSQMSRFVPASAPNWRRERSSRWRPIAVIVQRSKGPMFRAMVGSRALNVLALARISGMEPRAVKGRSPRDAIAWWPKS